jgi:hypothetical protein
MSLSLLYWIELARSSTNTGNVDGKIILYGRYRVANGVFKLAVCGAMRNVLYRSLCRVAGEFPPRQRCVALFLSEA